MLIVASAYVFILFTIIPKTISSSTSKNVFVRTCFKATETTEAGKKLVIPAALLRNDNQEEAMTIHLRFNNHSLNCNLSNALKHTVYWDNKTMHTSQTLMKLQEPRSFRTLLDALHKTRSHFLDDATFYNGTHYFSSGGDYCIQSYNSSLITLLLCPVNTTQFVQIPKCCAYDEVISLQGKCRKLFQNQTRWHPNLHLLANPSHKQQFTEYNTKKLRMFTENLYTKCQHIKRPPGSFFQYWSTTGMGSGINNSIKLVVSTTPQGTKQLVPFIFHVGPRIWKPPTPTTKFCVDGTYRKAGLYPNPNQTVRYTGRSKDFVIYWCETNPPIKHPFPKFNSWMYGMTSLISCIFYLATVLVYLLLLKQHKLPGLTVLMYSMAALGRHALATVSNFLSVFPNNHITGIISRGYGLCFFISVIRHYFYFASLFWMTIMNIKFVATFRQTKVIARNSRRIRTLMLFCLGGWGIPLILIGVFCAIDVVYKDPMTLVPVPAYGDLVCYVGRAFRGHYIYVPMAIILGANVPLVLLTLSIFWRARIERRKSLGGEESSKSTQASDYSPAFFLKLFVVMGGTELLSFLTWYYHVPEGNGFKPYWVVVIEASENFLAPGLLFGMFCLNKRIVRQVNERLC